jgi:peptidoglycan hydrolase CwlO-like protein
MPVMPEGPWKTWAPSLVGLVGVLAGIAFTAYQNGDSQALRQQERVQEQISALTLQVAKMNETLVTVCKQWEETAGEIKTLRNEVTDLRNRVIRLEAER